MKRIDFRKTAIAALIAAGTAAGAATVMADPPQGGGYGMGPGMMGGYGPGARSDADDRPQGGYGPGYGMGPGMMGGGMMGGYGMGLGMGMGYGMLSHFNLTQDQWNKIEQVQEETRKKNWDLMGKMQDESYELRKLLSAPQRDRKAISAQYRKLSDLRQQRFEIAMDAREKIEGVLTKEQREQLQRYSPWAAQGQ
ncbi:MAG TPA: Spy/CpxP family protein refolding chaperone [Pelomicrobium sp.]|nr:Spy/CpxP family protein refolding chaperone [Pelomicrobium sp.]